MSWFLRAFTSFVLLLASLAIFSSAFARTDDNVKPIASVSEPASEETREKPLKETVTELENATVQGKGARIVASFTVFLLAVFVGVEVINKVPATLHTPLMSGSNAISGITIIGALLAAGHASGGFGGFLGMVASILAMINVVGGFLVTHRMLMMFKRR
jgi:NAD(P) transhydrogenase subunit alpha